MKKFIKKLALYYLSHNIRINFRLNKINARNHLIILNLHRVCKNDGSAYQPLDPEIFKDLIAFLNKKFHIITFADLENALSLNTKKPSVILSFDDGYKDFIEVALPILRKHNIKANHNFIPECIESGKPPFNVVLQDFIGKASLTELNKLKIPQINKLPNIKDRVALGQKVSYLFKNRNFDEQQVLKEEIVNSNDLDLYNFSTPMMNLHDLKEALSDIEIGAHSFSHASMGLESNEFFLQDIEKCKEWFSNKLQENIQIYAFPNGSYRKEQLEIAKLYGYKHLLLVNEGFSSYNNNTFNRFTFYSTFPNEYKFRALGSFTKI